MGNRLLNHIVDNDADRRVCIRGNSEYINISRGERVSLEVNVCPTHTRDVTASRWGGVMGGVKFFFVMI